MLATVDRELHLKSNFDKLPRNINSINEKKRRDDAPIAALALMT
jgi:hypothetical protein